MAILDCTLIRISHVRQILYIARCVSWHDVVVSRETRSTSRNIWRRHPGVLTEFNIALHLQSRLFLFFYSLRDEENFLKAYGRRKSRIYCFRSLYYIEGPLSSEGINFIVTCSIVSWESEILKLLKCLSGKNKIRDFFYELWRELRGILELRKFYECKRPIWWFEAPQSVWQTKNLHDPFSLTNCKRNTHKIKDF